MEGEPDGAALPLLPQVLERRAKALAEAEPKEFLEEREAKKHKKQDL